MRRTVIENKAADILKTFNYDSDESIYVDAVKLAKSYGFIVGETDRIPEGDDGFIYVKGDVKVIGVNNKRSKEDKRFIVLHELGHYFLHNEQLKAQVMRREHEHGRSKDENDADYFAACVLMPEKVFKEEAKRLEKEGYEGKDKISKLQEIFIVSYESAKRRLEEVA